MQPSQHAQRTTGPTGTVHASGVPSLGDLLAGVEVVTAAGPWQSTPVTSLACQLHKLRPGGLWFAVPPGTSEEKMLLAIRRGASAVVADVGAVLPDRTTVPVVRVPHARTAMAKASAAFFGSPARDLRLVGVTGTNGKGTVALLLRSMLDAADVGGKRRAGYIGTLNADATTPEPPDLHDHLRRLRDSGMTDVCMEVSSHGLAWRRTAGLIFAAAVFTNLDHDHLDFHGTKEEYFRAKRRLFEADACRLAIVNRDDPWGTRLLSELDVPYLTYSLDDLAYVHHEDGGFRFGWHGLDVHLGLPGRYNLSNALAAATTAEALGVPGPAIVAALGSARLPRGRFERVDAGQDFEIVIDYAHTPGAVSAVLSAARRPGRRLIALVAGAGDRDPSKRPLMGLAASQLADVVVVTSEPGSESPAALVAAVRSGVSHGVEVHGVPHRADAIHLALALSRPGDVVVLTGKGHELTYCVGREVLPFDERQVVRNALVHTGRIRDLQAVVAC